jgi:hypothetical protein
VSYLRAFGHFWWDFIVGDEWRIAVVVAVATGIGMLGAIDHHLDGQVIACGVAAGIMVAVCDIVIATGRRSQD